MSRLTYKDGLSFEIYVMDLCEMAKPKTGEDLEELSNDMHERIEIAIEDFISGTELEGSYASQY